MQGRVPLEKKISHLFLNQLSTKQTQRPQCRDVFCFKIYALLLNQLHLGVPNAGQGRVLSEDYVPLLLIKLTYLHMQIRHVHLHFRNNIVLLMSFDFQDLGNPCRCKCVGKDLLDSRGAFKPSSQRQYRYPAPLVGNYTLCGMPRHQHFTLVTAWIKPCLVF